MAGHLLRLPNIQRRDEKTVAESPCNRGWIACMNPGNPPRNLINQSKNNFNFNVQAGLADSDKNGSDAAPVLAFDSGIGRWAW